METDSTYDVFKKGQANRKQSVMMANQVTTGITSQEYDHHAPSEVYNLYHCKANNIGDRMSGPGQYIWPESNYDLPIESVQKSLENVIIGGGQIFSQLSSTLSSIYDLNPAARAIAWGVGLPPAGIREKIVREVAQSFVLFGTRNYDRRDQFSFVPCASCLSPLFDKVAPPQHEVVFYLHRKKGELLDIPKDAPTLTNAMQEPRNTINFIASGETIVTSSYHGVYWAQLLGRRVVCIPYNNKFDTFQHSPTMANVKNWRLSVANASQTAPLLEEYRALNRDFAKKVLEIWNG